MSEELIPETPEQETEENEAAEPIKQRKNGLYPGVSDELAANMKSGWADTELHGLEPIAQAEHTAARRAALSARFPGERLVIPAGNLRTRSNDTEYAFRASTEYAYLTGDQTQDGVLVLEPTAEGHEATIYLLPRSDRENGEFWLDGQGELWVGHAALPRRGRAAAGHPREGRPRGRRRADRGHRPGPQRARSRRVHRGRPHRQGDRRARRGAARPPLRGPPREGRLRDRRAAEGVRRHRARLRGRRQEPGQGRGDQRALHRGHVLPPRPHRGQRHRLRLDLRRRTARHHPALGPQRRRRPRGRAAAPGQPAWRPTSSTPPT